MSMPRVVCSTTGWVSTKRSLRSYQKMDAKSRGVENTTQKQALRDHPKSCKYDRNYVAGLWIPGSKPGHHRFEEKMVTVTSLVGKPLNHALLFT